MILRKKKTYSQLSKMAQHSLLRSIVPKMYAFQVSSLKLSDPVNFNQTANRRVKRRLDKKVLFPPKCRKEIFVEVSNFP